MGREKGVLAIPAAATACALLVLLVPASALADRHKAEFGGGGAGGSRSRLWGIGITGGWILGEGGTTRAAGTASHGKLTLGLVGEVNQLAGDHEGGTFSQTTFLVGLRGTWNTHRYFQPFAQSLVGAACERGVEKRTSLAGGFGLGFDVPIPIGDRGDDPFVVLRGELNWLGVDSEPTDWYPQYALSVVFRLNEKH